MILGDFTMPFPPHARLTSNKMKRSSSIKEQERDRKDNPDFESTSGGRCK